MRVGIDVTFLFDQYSHRGIGTYGREVVARLIQNEEHEWVLFGFKELKSNLRELDVKPAKNINFVDLGKPRNSTGLNPLFFNFIFKRKILKSDLDVFFAPHFERGLPLGKVKTVVMMHDVIPFLTNSYSQKNPFANYLKGLFYRRNLSKARKSDLILTNSEFTKKELTKKAEFQSDNIKITPLAVNSAFRSENIHSDTRSLRRVLVMYKVSQPYVLYYGGLEANKNIEFLMQSFAKVTAKHPDLKLVISGKEFKVGWDSKPKAQTASAERLLEMIVDLKLQHKVVLTGEIKQIHLPLILKNAECFVNLSGYEGFGLSVLEAITAGVPVIASNKASYPEVLGKSAVLVDPKNPDLVAEKVTQVLQDNAVKQRLIKAGQMQAGNYSWDKTAKLTIQEIHNTVTKNPKLDITYLIARFYPEQGGAETNCYEIARRMVKEGHKVTILTTNNAKNSLPKNEDIEGMKIRRLRRLNNQYYLGFYPGLLRALLSSKSNIIHVHGFGFLWHDICLVIKRLVHRKSLFINTPHGPFMAHGGYSLPKIALKKMYTFFQRLFLNRLYDIVIQVNTQQYKWIKDYGIKKEKIKYLSNGINEDQLNPVKTSKTIEKYKLARRFVIAYTGRFEEYKGVQQVIKVLPRLVKLKPNLRFVAIGRGGNYLPNLETLVKNLEMEKYVQFIINPDDKTRDEILAQAKIFVMPSRWEAFGISILEAMAKKCAIISTQTEGGVFLIKDNENGLLYNFEDDKMLTKHIEKLLKDTNLLTRMQRLNYELAHNYLWENVAKDYQDMIFNEI